MKSLLEQEGYKAMIRGARKGGRARLTKMTAAQRKAIATKASKAAAKARIAKVKARKGGGMKEELEGFERVERC